MNEKYVDILIENDDMALDENGMPKYVADSDSIVQDLKHAVRESGYLVNLIAERSSEKRLLLHQQIIIVIENDERIIPGTVFMHEYENANLIIDAETYEFGRVALTVW